MVLLQTQHTYDLVEDGVHIGTDAAYSNVSIDGVSVSLSAWSDTVGTYNDDVVTSAQLTKLSNTYGYGIYNADDEINGYNPDHAIDNVNTLSYNVTHDFDYVLLSFSESVRLTGADFSWVANQYDTQVSIAALSDVGDLVSGTSTWSSIVEDALTAGSYNIEKCDYLDHRADFTLSSSAQYWLIGAYNTVFGNIGGNMYNDAFKLTGVGFDIDNSNTPPQTNVSEPHTLSALFACGLVIAWRRKSSKKT